MKQIFVVEDDEGIRELIEILLESHEYSVQTFPNARTFQNTVPGQVPDLFLIDIMLPDGNGVNLCKQLKASNETMGIPVVLMSAHANISHIDGADDFIAKPFDVDELIQRIEQQLV